MDFLLSIFRPRKSIPNFDANKIRNEVRILTLFIKTYIRTAIQHIVFKFFYLFMTPAWLAVNFVMEFISLCCDKLADGNK